MKETRSESKIVMLTKIEAIGVEGQKIYNLITKVIKLVKLVQSLFCISGKFILYCFLSNHF